MTPKEKAIELVNKFRDFANGTDYETDGFSPNIEKENGKQCALIAVDEAMTESTILPYGIEYLGRIDYWEEVKTEIEKL